MELQKLIDFVWKLIEDGIMDGDKVPDLDYCQEELNALIQGFAERKLFEEIGYLPKKLPVHENNND